jgi:NADPH2:quinone reductase
MKTIRVRTFGGPQELRLEDAEDPRPGAGQVVVRIIAAGVNPVDAAIREGKFTEEPSLPYTPGQDGAGIVEAVGAGVDNIRTGDRVWVYGRKLGTYREKALCPASAVQPLPARFSFAQGAAVGTPAAAAWRSLFLRGRAQAGETVLVHGGTGAVGISAIQLARAAGLIVIATASDEDGRREVRERGAHHAVDHADYGAIRRLTPDGRGVALILEEAAEKNLGDDLTALAPNGRVVVIGAHDTAVIDPRKTMTTELEIRGMSLTNATPEQEAATARALTAALEAGILQPVVTEEMPLADAPRAHEKLAQHAAGKIVLMT